MKSFRLIGKPLPRIDGFEKVSGRLAYCDDTVLPGMLFGKILRSPYPHAKIANIKTERARSLPGVKAVITATDTPSKKYGLAIADELPLALHKVRYIGDEIAAVAATDEETAEEALDLIEVDYEELPAVFDPADAIKPDSPLIHEANRNIAKRIEVQRGDIEQGFQEADFIFEDQYSTAFFHTAPIETTSCIADVDLSGNIILYMPLQDVGRSLPSIASALDIPTGRIRIVQTHVGGGFGGKNGITPACPISAFLAMRTGKPVRITFTRDEEFIATRPAVPMKIFLKMGVKKDGVITAKYSRILADNGAYSSHGPSICQAAAARFDSVYRQRNLKTEVELVYTNNLPTGAYRGYGANQVAFAVESHLDGLAEQIGMDPIELRLKNASRTGDVSVHGWKIHSCALEGCIKKASEEIGWGAFRKNKPPNRGMGVAASIHICGLKLPGRYSGSSIEVRIDQSGLVHVLSGEGEVGQGATTLMAQIVAEELGVPMEAVRVPGLDTHSATVGLGAFSSRVTVIAGNAARNAAASAKQKVLETAAEILEAPQSELVMADGRIFVRSSPEGGFSYSEFVAIATRMGRMPLIGLGRFDFQSENFDPATLYGDMSPTYSFAAHIVEVEVDPETGVVSLLNYAAAHDSGNIINPLGAGGQVEGGVLQGIGYALMEEVLLSKGKVQNASFMDYKLIKTTGVPPIKTLFIEVEDPVGPFGAKGLGEEVSVPVAPAIANAVYDAIGVRIKDLPITPEKILRALKEGKPCSGDFPS